MSSSLSFNTQLASIMEVLANAAVAEICKLVEEGYAVLRLEISRSREENDALRKQLEAAEERDRIAADTPGTGRKEALRGDSAERTFASDMSVGLWRDSGTTPVQNDGQSVDLKRETPNTACVKQERSDDDLEGGDQEGELKMTRDTDYRLVDTSVEDDENVPSLEIKVMSTRGRGEQSKKKKSRCVVWVEDKLGAVPKDETPSETAETRMGPRCGAAAPNHLDYEYLMYDRINLDTFSSHGVTEDEVDDPASAFTAESETLSEVSAPPDNAGGAFSVWNKVPVFGVVRPQLGRYSQEEAQAQFPLGKVTVFPSNTEKTTREDTVSEPTVPPVGGWPSSDDRFTRSKTVKSHHRNGVRGKLFICTFCGKGLACLKNLKTHQRVHTGEKPFSCAQCGKRFADSSNFKRHQSVHTGERRYSCTFCGKRFGQSGSLKVHLRVHTGHKQFICSQCGKCFISSSHLRRHLSVHVGETVM